MAEVLLRHILIKLGRSLAEESTLLLAFQDQVEWLVSEYSMMKNFLLESDLTSSLFSEKHYLSFIRDLAHRSEDIIDLLQFKSEKEKRSRGLRRLFHRAEEVASLISAAHKIKDIKERISSSTYAIALQEQLDINSKDYTTSDWRTSARGEDQYATVGLEVHKEIILDQLLDSGPYRLSVVAIVGVIGIGKTTLARVVYESVQAKLSFEVRLWVNVCHKNMFRMLKLMLGSVKVVPASELEAMEYEVMEEKLREYLKKRRYLIVYDGLEEREVWNALQKLLPDAGNGSRVIITTRSSEIACPTYGGDDDDDTFIYQLPLLNEEDSFQLLCNHMRGLEEKTKDIYPLLNPDDTFMVLCNYQPYMRGLEGQTKDICEQLVSECGGLPFALVTYGRLLNMIGRFHHPASLRPENSLNTVSLLAIDEYPYGLWMEFKAMIDGGLSFGPLPHHLKQCLLYLVAVPRGSQIQVGKLVRLWIAEGFIPWPEGLGEEETVLEETAGSFLQQLIQRSLIQVVSQRPDGTPRTCRMPTALREYYMQDARERLFLNDEVGRDDHMPVRWSACLGIDRLRNALPHASPQLRTLIGFNLHSNKGSLDCAPITRLELLRVVDLEDAPLKKLPAEIGNLILLRYLGLRNTNLEELPASLGNLLLLQTLDIRSTYIHRLPEAFWKIRRLRHIFLGWNTVCPSRIDRLKDLQTLRNAAAGPWISHGLSRKSIRNLKIYDIQESHTSNLWEMLRDLDRLTSLSLKGEALHAGLMNFSAHERLHTLDLGGAFGMTTLPEANDFPQNLTKLTLRKSGLELDPMDTLMRLPSLRVLRLCDAYGGDKMTCYSGGFPELQHLVLGRLRKLESWIVEDGAMPKLKFLSIVSCKSLTQLPDGLKQLKSLNKIELVDMPANFAFRVQKDVGEDWPKIQHVANVHIR